MSDKPPFIQIVKPDGTIIPIPVDTSGLLMVGIEGYYNSAWRKSPIPWGASNDYGHNWQNLNLPAGASNQDSGALTANAWTVITQWSFLVNSLSATINITLMRMDGGVLGTQRTLQSFLRVTASTWYSWSGFIVCKSTDILRVYVQNANLNDDLYVSVNGYTVDLNL